MASRESVLLQRLLVILEAGVPPPPVSMLAAILPLHIAAIRDGHALAQAVRAILRHQKRMAGTWWLGNNAWKDSDGFEPLGVMLRTTHVQLLNQLRAAYPRLYHYATRWYDPESDQVKAWDRYMQGDHTSSRRTFRNPAEYQKALTELFLGALYLTMTNAEIVAQRADLATMVQMSGTMAPTEYSRSTPDLRIVDIIDPRLKQLAGGKSRCILRGHKVNTKHNQKKEIALANRLEVTLQLMQFKVKWPLAVCLHYALPFDFFLSADGALDYPPGERAPPKPKQEKTSPLLINTAFVFEDYCETSLVDIITEKRPFTPQQYAGTMFQVLFAYHAAIRLFGFRHNDIAPKHVMFSDVSGTPMADRPWAYRFKGAETWHLLSPAAHQNKLVKLIDFDIANIGGWANMVAGQSYLGASERHCADLLFDTINRNAPQFISRLYPTATAMITHTMREHTMISLLSNPANPYASEWATTPYFTTDNVISTVPSDGLLPRTVYEIRNDAPADPARPVLVGFIPDTLVSDPARPLPDVTLVPKPKVKRDGEAALVAKRPRPGQASNKDD